MRATVCTNPGCGRTIGVGIDSRREPILRTRPHKNLAGGKCLPYQVDEGDAFQTNEAAHRTARTALRDRARQVERA